MFANKALGLTLSILRFLPPLHIVDALFAVYEASTLELWSFMFYTAVDGQDFVQASIFFVFLVIFIVILLQVEKLNAEFFLKFVYTCVCLCLSVCLCMCVFLYICVYVFVCVYVCVCVDTCVL